MNAGVAAQLGGDTALARSYRSDDLLADSVFVNVLVVLCWSLSSSLRTSTIITMRNPFRPSRNGRPERRPDEILPWWARSLSVVLGVAAAVVGSIGVLTSDNQAGTVAIVLVGAVLVLVGLQGTPIAALRSGEHAVDFERQLTAKVVEDAERSAAEDSPEVAAKYITKIQQILPDHERRRVDPYLWESQLRLAIQDLGYEVETTPHSMFSVGRLLPNLIIFDANGTMLSVLAKHADGGSIPNTWVWGKSRRWQRTFPQRPFVFITSEEIAMTRTLSARLEQVDSLVGLTQWLPNSTSSSLSTFLSKSFKRSLRMIRKDRQSER
ncbi:hypothetical protein [Salininema proteolyticum]|uniref:NERD domain-containing protein n=1 Tax=Salininema proteolyticum TaxID=1607685 RepID=A0ABV8TUE9_9ACTN